jgi:hypothetical protein
VKRFKNNLIAIGVATIFAVGAFALQGLAVSAAEQANLIEKYAQGNLYTGAAFVLTFIGALAVGVVLWQIIAILIALAQNTPAKASPPVNIVPASADIELAVRQVRFDIRTALDQTKAGKQAAQVIKPIILERGLAMAKLAVKFARRLDILNGQLELTGWVRDALREENIEEALSFVAELNDLALRVSLTGDVQDPFYWRKLHSYVIHRMSAIRRQRTDYKSLLMTMFTLLKQMQDDLAAIAAYIGGAEVDEIMLELTLHYDAAFDTLVDYNDILLESPYTETQRALLTE